MSKIAFWYRNLTLSNRVIISINAAIFIAFVFISIIATINRTNTQENVAVELANNEIEQIIKTMELFPDSDVQDFKEIIHSISLFNTGFVSIVNSAGDVLVCKRRENQNISRTEHFEQIHTLKRGQSTYTDPATNLVKYQYFDYIPQSGLYVVVTLERDEFITTQVRNTQRVLFFALLITLGIFTLVNYLIMKTITDPIKKIKFIIEKLSKGELPEEYRYKYKDDVGQMTVSVNNLVAGLKHTTSFANSIGVGNFDHIYKPLSENDTLGNTLLDLRDRLKTADEEQKVRKIEDEKRNWGTQGLAKFAEILRDNNDNLQELSYNIIKNLVKYLEINQGGIFLYVDNGEIGSKGYLEMTASYAFDRRKYLQRKVMIGEGLIGTCYLEKESIYLTKIPQEYIKITSGLGDKSPSSLLIVPLKLNGVVYGIVELASFRPFEQYHIDFVEKIGESIASTISSVKVNLQTTMLLQKSQIQAEEMRSAEEEMKQNMEELTATQEAMADNEKKNLMIIEKLSQEKNNTEESLYTLKSELTATLDEFPNALVQYDFNKAFIFINQEAENLLNSKKSEFIGKSIDVLFNEGSQIIDTYPTNTDITSSIKTKSDKNLPVIIRCVKSGSGEQKKTTIFIRPLATGDNQAEISTKIVSTDSEAPEVASEKVVKSRKTKPSQTDDTADSALENLITAKDADTQKAWSQHLEEKGKQFKKGKKF